MILTATALAAEAVSLLKQFLQKGKDSIAGEAGKTLFNWVKDKLTGKGKEKQLEALGALPDNDWVQGEVKSSLEGLLSANPGLLAELNAFLEKSKAEINTTTTTISNSKNVVTGNIHAGGNVTIGDNNSYSK